MKLTKPGQLRSFAAYPRCSADQLEATVIAAVLSLSVLTVGASAAAAASPDREVSPDVWVSVVAGFNFGPGWWYVDVARSAEGRAVASGSELLERKLSPGEDRTLARLVAALPVDRKLSYGVGYSDAITVFQLRVKSHDGWRTYSVTSDLGQDAGKQNVQAILRVLQFVYSLLGSTNATRPPEPAVGARGRRTRG